MSDSENKSELSQCPWCCLSFKPGRKGQKFDRPACRKARWKAVKTLRQTAIMLQDLAAMIENDRLAKPQLGLLPLIQNPFGSRPGTRGPSDT